MENRSHNSYEYGRREFHAHRDENGTLGGIALAILVLCIGGYVLINHFHIRPYQLVEAGVYLACVLGGIASTTVYCLTLRKRREKAWPRPAIHVPMLRDVEAVRRAVEENSCLLGYEDDREPFFWSDHLRAIHALLLGASGSGKTTLLHNVLGQDFRRVFGPKEAPRRMPVIIFDGKGEQNFLLRLLPDIAAAGRLHQLRVLDLARPDISVRYNPLNVKTDNYQEHVNFIFASFGLGKDFFEDHQFNYFSNLARILVYAGKPFNVHDIMVMALDERVLREQVKIARFRMEHMSGLHEQQVRNFEMSARLLLVSLQDQERVQKIQGLLNKLNRFLEDNLSLITAGYDNLLTLEEVIDQDLILYVSLNNLLNEQAVDAMGKIMLHNLQLMVGKRYANQWREGGSSPMLSIVIDEFSDYAYKRFASMLQKARGTNTSILFSLQSISQLLAVSPSFMEEVSSAPNTILSMLVRDKANTEFFRETSGKVLATRRSLTVEQKGLFSDEYRPIGFGSEIEYLDTRAKDEHVRNLLAGQFQMLMSDAHEGLIYKHLHGRRPFPFTLSTFSPRLYPVLDTAYRLAPGAKLRFADSEPSQFRNRHSSRGERT